MSSLAADSPRITEGSNVTLLYQITVPGEKFEVRDVGQFVQGQHQLLPVLERVVTGLKSGDEKKIDLSAEDGFGPYDANKKKTVPRSDLPPDTKEGDVMQDRAGQHLPHLVGHAGHRVEASAILELDDQPWRRPSVGLDPRGTLGHVRLPKVALGHRAGARPPRELPAEHRFELVVEDEGPLGEQRDRVAGDVVLRRPEPAAHEHHVGARGAGKWERVTWDEALDDIAGRVRKALLEERRNEIMYHVGRPGHELLYHQRILHSWGIDGHNSHTNVCSAGARAGVGERVENSALGLARAVRSGSWMIPFAALTMIFVIAGVSYGFDAASHVVNNDFVLQAILFASGTIWLWTFAGLSWFTGKFFNLWLSTNKIHYSYLVVTLSVFAIAFISRSSLRMTPSTFSVEPENLCLRRAG